MGKLCVELARAIRTDWSSVTEDKIQWALHKVFSMSDEEITDNTKDKQLRLSGEVTIPVPVEGVPVPIPIKHDDSWTDRRRDYKWVKQIMSGATDASFSLVQQAAIATTFIPSEGFNLLRKCVESEAQSMSKGGFVSLMPIGDLIPKHDGRCRVGVEMRYYRSKNDYDEPIGDREKNVELVFDSTVLNFVGLEGGGLNEIERKKKIFKLQANTNVTAWFDRSGTIEQGYDAAEIRLAVVGLSHTPQPITFPALRGFPPKSRDFLEFTLPASVDLRGPDVDDHLRKPSVDWPGHDGSVTFEFLWDVKVNPIKWTVELHIWGKDRLTNYGDFMLAAQYSITLPKDFSSERVSDPSIADCLLVLDPNEFKGGSVSGVSRPGQGVSGAFSPAGSIVQSISGAIGGGSAEGGNRTVSLRSFKLFLV